MVQQADHSGRTNLDFPLLRSADQRPDDHLLRSGLRPARPYRGGNDRRRFPRMARPADRHVRYRQIGGTGSDHTRPDHLPVRGRVGKGTQYARHQRCHRRLRVTGADQETEEGAIVSVPKRRIDISIKEDLNEEVGRIYGLDNIEGILPEMPLKRGTYDRTSREIRNKMIGLGLNETLSYVLVAENEAKEFVKDDNESIKLLDPMSEDRNTLRNSIIPSLMNIYGSAGATGEMTFDSNGKYTAFIGTYSSESEDNLKGDEMII